MKQFKYLMAVIGMVGFLCIGCGEPAKDKDKEGKKVGGKQEQSHDHHHVHVHGPMGGEMLDIGDTGLKAEVVHKKGQNLLQVIVYENDGKTEKKIECDKLIGKIASKKDTDFEFVGTNTEDGATSRFEMENEDFSSAYSGFGFNVTFNVDGKEHKVTVPKDPH